jgi:tetratricopeptide (TPR) repeat protein
MRRNVTALGIALVTTLSVGRVVGQVRPTQAQVGHAQVKATAAQQLAYAKQTMQLIPANGPLRDEAVFNSITALRAVHEKWPDQSAAVAQAYLLEAELFERQNMLTTALDTLRAAEPSARAAGQTVAVLAREGRIEWRLHKYADAADTFTRAERLPAFNDLPALQQMDTLNYFSEAESALSHHREAAAHLRRASALSSLPLMTRLTLTMRTLENDERSGDKGESKRDLKSAKDLLDQVMQTQSLGPAGAAALDQYISHVKKLEKALGD